MNTVYKTIELEGPKHKHIRACKYHKQLGKKKTNSEGM